MVYYPPHLPPLGRVRHVGRVQQQAQRAGLVEAVRIENETLWRQAVIEFPRTPNTLLSKHLEGSP